MVSQYKLFFSYCMCQYVCSMWEKMCKFVCVYKVHFALVTSLQSALGDLGFHVSRVPALINLYQQGDRVCACLYGYDHGSDQRN